MKLLHLANYFHVLREEQWSSCLYRGVVQKGTVPFALSPAEQMDQCACGSGGERLVGLKVCSPPLFIKAPFVPLIADPTVILQKNPKHLPFIPRQ